jgi:hypothetical protein
MIITDITITVDQNDIMKRVVTLEEYMESSDGLSAGDEVSISPQSNPNRHPSSWVQGIKEPTNKIIDRLKTKLQKDKPKSPKPIIPTEQLEQPINSIMSIDL